MEFLDHRKHECGKVPVAHADRIRVGSGLEDDLLIFRERLINIHREPIEIAEGRHGAQLAVGKQPCDLISQSRAVRDVWQRQSSSDRGPPSNLLAALS